MGSASKLLNESYRFHLQSKLFPAQTGRRQRIGVPLRIHREDDGVATTVSGKPFDRAAQSAPDGRVRNKLESHKDFDLKALFVTQVPDRTVGRNSVDAIVRRDHSKHAAAAGKQRLAEPFPAFQTDARGRTD